MNNDIFLDLAVEKVRIDFGDLVASFFRTISTNENCFLGHLIRIFSHLSYRTIRSCILTLFQFNLIILENFKTKKISLIDKIHSPKISTIISEAIYRIRYPRFIALIEYDYGTFGAIITKSIVNSGQVYLSGVAKNSIFQSFENRVIAEDILIHMARDKLIVHSNVFSKKIKSLNFIKKNFPLQFFQKPTFSSFDSIWKILTSTFNIRLKLNTLFSLLQEYHEFQTKQVIKFYISKLLSLKSSFIDNIWLSLDTISDFCKDELIDLYFDEKSMIRLIKNLCFVHQSVDLKRGYFKLNLKIIKSFFREKLVKNLLINQFGKKFEVIFQILASKQILDEKELLYKSGFNKFHLKTILYQMHRLGFVFLEDSEIYRKVPKDTRFWKLDLTILSKKLVLNTIKTLYNLLLRLENYYWIINKFFDSIKGEKNSVLNKQKKEILIKRINTLLIGITRTDEVLSLLYF